MDPNETRPVTDGQKDRTLAIKFRFFLPPEVEVLLPGIILTSIISAIALHTGAKLHYVTPLIASMAAGMILRNAFIIPDAYKPGIFFSMRQVLRFAVALLGVRITLDNITGLGWEGLAVALVPLMATMIFTVLMGRILGVDPFQRLLIATGTSICGASAILAAGAITRSKEDSIIVAISSITVFGTISMLLYPIIHNTGILQLTLEQYGFWAGSSIHEVAQVIAASFAPGEASGDIGTIVKLTRVAGLVPVAFVFSYLVAHGILKRGEGKEDASVAFPFFLLGFIGMVVLNSLEFFTPKAVSWIEFFDMFLLTMAMAGMGLETDFGRLLKVGFKPFFLSVFSTGFIAILSLLLIKMLIPS